MSNADVSASNVSAVHGGTAEAAQDEQIRAEDNGNVARGCGLSGCVDVAVCRVEWLYYMGGYQVSLLSAWSLTLQAEAVQRFVRVMAMHLKLASMAL